MSAREEAARSRQKENFDRRHCAKSLDPLEPGDSVWITDRWSGVKTGVWLGKSGKWCCVMAVNFSVLVLKTGTGPYLDIGVDSWPNELAGHQTLSCLDTKGMKCVKNCSTETFRYVWAEHSCGYVIEDDSTIRQGQRN